MSSPPAKPPKPKNVKLVRAEHAYVTEEEDELSFEEGDLLYILDSSKSYLINLILSRTTIDTRIEVALVINVFTCFPNYQKVLHYDFF